MQYIYIYTSHMHISKSKKVGISPGQVTSHLSVFLPRRKRRNIRRRRQCVTLIACKKFKLVCSASPAAVVLQSLFVPVVGAVSEVVAALLRLWWLLVVLILPVALVFSSAQKKKESEESKDSEEESKEAEDSTYWRDFPAFLSLWSSETSTRTRRPTARDRHRGHDLSEKKHGKLLAARGCFLCGLDVVRGEKDRKRLKKNHGLLINPFA